VSRPVAEVVIATGNAGKLREFREILADLPLRLRGLDEFPPVDFPEEGAEYEPNAIAKAETAARATGLPALADDSGLEVAALDGAPGPLSARFGGLGLKDHERAAHLLDRLRDVPADDRAARFVCIAALAHPGDRSVTARGECPGKILTAPQGDGGFGYDPVFEVEPGVAMAELPAERKNAISHRARALAALRGALLALE
jgi:XTP/dITP diphosphohydrolase